MSSNANQLREQLNSLKQQYNTLLEKNQNDLIKIKQKQKTFNEAINQLKTQKQQQQKKYKSQIDALVLQIQKLKYGDNRKQGQKQFSDTTMSQKNLQIKNSKAEISELNSIIELNKDRIDQLEENARKLMDENIDLNSQKESYKRKNTEIELKISEYEKSLGELKSELSKIKNKKVQKVERQIQSEGDFIISEKEHQKIIKKFNQQIQNLILNVQSFEKQNEALKSRLGQTNEELKRYIERDRKNNVLIKRKNEEIANMESDIENFKKKASKPNKKLPTEESCVKCKEWEQENRLLKEMVKSVQTMVRVKEMEAERYKTRELANSKLIEKTERVESKRSRGELPPLKKNN